MLNEQEKQDLENLEEIYDAVEIGQALQDGAYGYEFNDEELAAAFKQAKEAFEKIDGKYSEMLSR